MISGGLIKIGLSDGGAVLLFTGGGRTEGGAVLSVLDDDATYAGRRTDGGGALWGYVLFSLIFLRLFFLLLP